MKPYLLLFATVMLAGCDVMEDVSLPASEANDLSLVLGQAQEVNSGYIFMRPVEGTDVKETFQIILPKGPVGEFVAIADCTGNQVGGGIDGNNVAYTINISDLVGNTWTPSLHDCEIRVLAKLRFEINGEPKSEVADGIVRTRTLKQGYQVLPLDSPYAAYKLKYRKHEVVYSSKMRSSVEVLE